MKNKYIKLVNDECPRLPACLLRIIVPTLNRPKAVLKNLNYLTSLFSECEINECQIVCSENHSDQDFLVQSEDLPDAQNLFFVVRPQRLGLGEHMHWLSSLEGAQWHMWVGDDDLVHPDFAIRVLKEIQNAPPDLNGIYPDREAFSEDDFFKDDYAWEVAGGPAKIDNVSIKTTKAVWEAIYRGHQLSGLTIRASIEHDVFIKGKLPAYNLYPWMAFHALALERGSLLHIRDLPSKITMGTPKLFSYRSDGLLPEISESIRCGFYNNKLRGFRYAIEILGRGAGIWRIFLTNKSVIICLWNYLNMFASKRLHPVVFIGVLPFVFKSAVNKMFNSKI